MTRPFHAGLAARIGVLSAWMAREGFTANTAIFDDGGFFTTCGGKDGESLADVVALMGKPWEMAKPVIYVKRWRAATATTGRSCVAGYTDVAVVMKRGRFETRIEHAPGSPEAPMTADDRVGVSTASSRWRRP